MDQRYKAKWRQAEADLQDLCQSNSAQAQSLASKLQETNLEHQQLHTAQERQRQLEARALRQAQIEEQQTAATAREHELAIQDSRDKPKNSQNFSNFNGDISFLNRPLTRPRSMNSILRCSTCVKSPR